MVLSIDKGLEKGEEKVEKEGTGTMPFLLKFLELQLKMIHHNNQLTKSHPYASTPISWPFVIRGISFWEKKEGLKQIYLLGNPIAWWISIIGPFLYVAMWILDRLLLRRGIDDFGPAIRTWWDRSIGFLFLSWFMHWGPFFLMGRMLFLHHYMPAYIFSTWITTTLFDFLGRNFVNNVLHHQKTRYMVWRRPRIETTSWTYLMILGSLGIAVLAGFWYFMPLCYGLGFPSLEVLRAHKWLPTWDLQYA
jgi:dolichyl-phosphate-mannose-protein mannosyltransferase